MVVFKQEILFMLSDVTDIMIKLMKKIKNQKGFYAFNLGTGRSSKN